MSTGLNSMTGVIFEDLIKPRLKRPMTEARASLLMKVIVVVIGAICVGLVFVVEKLGTLIQAAGSIGAITAGPLLGVFSLGMFFPGATSEVASGFNLSRLLIIAKNLFILGSTSRRIVKRRFDHLDIGGFPSANSPGSNKISAKIYFSGRMQCRLGRRILKYHSVR